MAKSSRGGKRTSATAGGAVNVAATQGGAPADDQQIQIDDTQQAQPMSATYDSFMAMSDDDKADAIATMASQPAPAFLSDTALQRFTYNLGMNDKPTLVDDATLDSMNGTELFRTVNAGKDSVARVKYDADEIAVQVQRGRVTRYSDNGGSVYGRGLYFADNYGDSSIYGNTAGNIKSTAMIRCKVNSNAKAINYSRAKSGLQSEISSGSKLGKALSKINSKDSQSAVSIYALAKGYNVITSGHGYFNVLNRNAVTMSTTIKGMSRNGRW